MQRDLLAWHGRFPRRSVLPWIHTLENQLSAVSACDSHALIIGGLAHQAVVISTVIGDSETGQKIVADRLSAFEFSKKEHHKIPQGPLFGQALTDRVIASAAFEDWRRALSVGAAALVALEEVRNSLDNGTVPLWHESTKADIQLEMCKLALGSTEADHDHIYTDILADCATQRVLKGVAVECYVVRLLRRHEIVTVQSLLAGMSAGDPSRLFTTLRLLEHDLLSGGRLRYLEAMSRILSLVEKALSGQHQTVDHLYLADHVSDMMAVLGMMPQVAALQKKIRARARSLGDAPFMLSSVKKLATVNGGHRDWQTTQQSLQLSPVTRVRSQRLKAFAVRLNEAMLQIEHETRH